MKTVSSIFHWTSLHMRKPRAIPLGALVEKDYEGHEKSYSAASLCATEEGASVVSQPGSVAARKMDRDGCGDAAIVLKRMLRKPAGLLRPVAG